MSVSFSACLCLYFCHTHTQTMQAMMYAQLVLTEPSRKRVVYRSPVDILIWIAFHFLETWNFNCAGAIEVRLSMFDHGGKPLKICCVLNDWFTEWICHIVHKAKSEIMVSNHTRNGPTPAYTICYKEFCIISLAKMLFHTSVLWKQ